MNKIKLESLEVSLNEVKAKIVQRERTFNDVGNKWNSLKDKKKFFTLTESLKTLQGDLENLLEEFQIWNSEVKEDEQT